MKTIEELAEQAGFDYHHRAYHINGFAELLMQEFYKTLEENDEDTAANIMYDMFYKMKIRS